MRYPVRYRQNIHWCQWIFTYGKYFPSRNKPMFGDALFLYMFIASMVNIFGLLNSGKLRYPNFAFPYYCLSFYCIGSWFGLCSGHDDLVFHSTILYFALMTVQDAIQKRFKYVAHHVFALMACTIHPNEYLMLFISVEISNIAYTLKDFCHGTKYEKVTHYLFCALMGPYRMLLVPYIFKFMLEFSAPMFSRIIAFSGMIGLICVNMFWWIYGDV